MPLDPEDYFARRLEGRLNAHPRLAGDLRGLEATAQIELREAPPELSDWHIVFSRGTASVHRGKSGAPSFGVFLHVEDWRDLIDGAATLRACIIDGRVEIEGDLGQAVQLVPLILASSAGD